MKPPGFLSPLSLIGSGLVILIVGIATWLAGGVLFSPGPLNAEAQPRQPLNGVTSHAELSGDCAACHPPPWSAERMSDRCMACHGDVKTQFASRSGLHVLISAGENCRECHSEHAGVTGELTHFAIEAEMHKRTGFSLAQHKKQADGSPFECTACHTAGYVQLDQSACSDCHAGSDPLFMTQHRADYGDDCLACHNGVSYLASYDHGLTRMPLDGKHAALKCRDCHAGRPQLAGLPVACAGCHADNDPHAGRLGQECGACHATTGWTSVLFDHASTGFLLQGKHAAAPCLDCHADLTFAVAGSTCNACHAKDDAHQDKFGADCGACHKPTAWADVSFDHNTTAFPLTGSHAGLPCANCHAERTFAVPGSTCNACHAKDDAHQGKFGSDCGACHKPTAWTEASFDHNTTSFPLTGKHAGLPCANCHAERTLAVAGSTCTACHAKDDAHQGKLGSDCGACHKPTTWTDVSFDHNTTTFPLTGKHAGLPCAGCHAARTFAVAGATCSACHANDDVHKGHLGANCAGCHKPTAWTDVSFDHGSTRFPLAGTHATVACLDCHADRTFAAAGSACITCHAKDDAHGGRFGTDCARCHQATTWKDASFDHNQTALPLTGAHAGVACTRCHTGTGFAVAGTSCRACHAADDAHNGAFGTDCGACHKPTTWTDVTFDHNTTAFPLRGAHAGVACAGCHSRPGFGVPGTSCRACHATDDAHGGAFGTDCGACHRPTTWTDVTFDHSTTAFPLTGAHAGVACASCHTGGGFAVAGTSCRACHAADDAHNGTFGTDCGACHKPTAWTDASIDHSKTAFPLTGQHQALQCSQCHANGVFQGTPTTCSACHTAPTTHVGTLFTGACSGCHSTAGWVPATLPNHPFPLNHGRTTSACAVCHPTNYADYTCYGCHEHTQARMVATHAEHGITDLSDCVHCHPGGRSGEGD
jgi:hypothetical protein